MIGYISLIVATIVLAFLVFRYRPKEKPKEYVFKPAKLDAKEQEFLKFVNQGRKENNAVAVKADEFCSLLCQEHNADMVRTGKTVHLDPTDPAVDNNRFVELMDRGALGYDEIVGSHFYNVESAYKAFRRSPSHWKAIIGKGYNACGLNISPDVNGNDYYTMIFLKI